MYDEAGNRFTISKYSADFIHFAFPKDENGKRDILNLTFRVIQYADSGYELVSEYHLKVYPTGEPIIDNLYLYKSSMDEPETFETLIRDYYGTVYKREPGYGVLAEAEYFDLKDETWRDGKLTMVAQYGKLIPNTIRMPLPDANGVEPYEHGWVETYHPTDTITLYPGDEWYEHNVAYERGSDTVNHTDEILAMDSKGRWPKDAGYEETWAKKYTYTMYDAAARDFGRETFTGLFPQETLPNKDKVNSLTLNGQEVTTLPGGQTIVGYDGAEYLPWDLPFFEVTVTLTYPYGYYTAKNAGAGPDGVAYVHGDYLDKNGNFVAAAGTNLDAPGNEALKEAATEKRAGSYRVHMTRSNLPILFTTLDDLEAFQMYKKDEYAEHRDLIQIGAVMTGPDYNDVLYGKDGELLPPGEYEVTKDDGTKETVTCAPNFAPKHPYYLLTLDHRLNKAWLKFKAKDNQRVTITASDVRGDHPESYLCKVDATNGDTAYLLDFGEEYYADEDYKALIDITVADNVPGGNVSHYMIWVVRGERSDSPSEMDVELFYGLSKDEAHAAAQDTVLANQATLYQAPERLMADKAPALAAGTAATLADEEKWGTYFLEDGELKVYPGIIDNAKKLYRGADGELHVDDDVPAGFTALSKVDGFNSKVYLYTTTLPMSAKHVTLDLSRFGEANVDHASVVYNNEYYYADGSHSSKDPTEDHTLNALVDIQLKQAEQVSYLFVTVHPDLKTGDGLHKDDDFYKENATTYVIRIKRLNTEAFQNIWVTDTEFKMTKKGTVTKDNRPEHFEQMWLIHDLDNMKQEFNDVRAMYDAAGNLLAGKLESDLADQVDVTWLTDGTYSKNWGNAVNPNVQTWTTTKGEQLHNVYDSDVRHQYADYGVMVSTLDSEIQLNAEAMGTGVNGENDAYYIIIEEYGVANPQRVDSRTFDDGDGPGKITEAKFRLDPSKDGEQVFQFTIVNTTTGTEGVYFLHVFREITDEKKVQTRVIGNMETAATRVPVYKDDGTLIDPADDPAVVDPNGDGYKNDFVSTITVYRKSDLLRYYQGWDALTPNDTTDTLNPAIPTPHPTFAEGWYSVDQAVEKYLPGSMTKTYTERFEDLLAYSVDGVPALMPVNVINTVTGNNLTREYDGKYELDFTGQEAGTYMVVFQRPGSLDMIYDNIIVSETWAKAQYNFGPDVLIAGDLNHDGIIDEGDSDLFNRYKNAMDGVFYQLAGRVALSKVTHTGSIQNRYNIFADATNMVETLKLADLNNIRLMYTDYGVTSPVQTGVIATDSQGSPVAFSRGDVKFYLSRNAVATKVDESEMIDLSALLASGVTEYEFKAGENYAETDLGSYYIYGVFKFYDSGMTESEDKLADVEVVYKVTTITVVREEPEVPEVPEVPSVPEAPEVPDMPDEGETPDVSDEVEVPNEPDEIETPDTPDEVEVPNDSDEVETPDASDEVEVPNDSGEIETPDASDEVETPDVSDEATEMPNEPEVFTVLEPMGVTAEFMVLESVPDEPEAEAEAEEPTAEDDLFGDVKVTEDEPAAEEESASKPAEDNEFVDDGAETPVETETPDAPAETETSDEKVETPAKPVGSSGSRRPSKTPSKPAKVEEEDERPEIPPAVDDDEREEIPVIDVTIPDHKVELPDGTGDETPDELDILAMYLVENNISLNSAEAQALMLEMISVTASTSFDYRLLDLDGNGLLTDADITYIFGHWGRTAYSSCRLENMYSRYRITLRSWN